MLNLVITFFRQGEYREFRYNRGKIWTTQWISLKMKYFIVNCPFIDWCTPHVKLNMQWKAGNDGCNGVVEAIYKLKCGIFARKNTGKKLQTQGKYRELHLYSSVATLNKCHLPQYVPHCLLMTKNNFNWSFWEKQVRYGLYDRESVLFPDF